MNEVRRSHRSTSNRISSIIEDAEYVFLVHETYKRPLVPNKRCGLWYVKPDLRASEAYFKSTDGHTGQWSFSLKRLNLHLLPLIESNGGIILVDSTRRGKLMPDALSKTIPVWCAVINNLMFGAMDSIFPPDSVSKSEQDQIRARVPQWVAQFRHEVPQHLWPKLSKPLRPMWTTPNSPLPFHEFDSKEPIFEDAHAVILCTASKRAQDGELYSHGFAYVQGAADDHELWAPQGFTPEMLWGNESIREPGIGDVELLRRMREAVALNKNDQKKMGEPTQIIQVHPYISIAHCSQESTILASFIIDLRSKGLGKGLSKDLSKDLSKEQNENNELEKNQWPLASGKRGAKELGHELPHICKYYEGRIHEPVTIVSDPGTDFAECVALLLDCRYFDAHGAPQPAAKYVQKDEVVRRNLVIIAKSGLAPSRTTQNIIGSFLRR